MKPLRIIIVTQSYHPVHGGIGEHARHLGLALQNRDHEVRILTSGPAPAGGELPDLDVVRIGRRFQVPSNGSRASIAFHPFYRRAVREVVGSDVDLVHIHSPLEPFLPWAVIQESCAPCVGTFHNAGPRHWGYRHLYRWLSPLADRLALRTAVSKCAAAYAGRHFPGTFLIVPNGVDTDRFSPSNRRDNNRRPTILFVGRLEKRKGLDVLVDGVANASECLPKRPRLVVVGDGSLRGRLLKRARDAAIDLDWHRSVAVHDLPSFYRDADLLVAPALFGESFGIVLLEAMASGLPVVASRIEGFSELLSGCPGAHLFTPGDSEAMAMSIVAGLEDQAEAGAIRMHARSYSWTRVATITERVYTEALEGRPAAVPRFVCASQRRRQPDTELDAAEEPIRSRGVG